MNFKNLSIYGMGNVVEQLVVLDQSGKNIIFTSPTGSELYIAAFIALLTIASLPGNVAVFTGIFRNGLMSQPIKGMALVDQLIYSVHIYANAVYFMFTMVTKTPVGSILGPKFCDLYYIVQLFGVLYITLGSLPIAVFRLAIIKRTMSQRLQKALANSLLALCLTGNALMTIVYTRSPAPGAYVWGHCNGFDVEFGNVLSSYTLGNTWMRHMHSRIIKGTIFFQHLEGFIYCAIFLDIYNSEKTVRHFLTEKASKARRRRNFLTMNCLICMYAMDQIYMYLLLLKPIKTVRESESGRVWMTSLIHVFFALRCSLQALSSGETRQELKSQLEMFKKLFHR